MKKPIQKLLAVATFVGATATGAIAAPRTLANGAPAPGNTVAKGETYSYKQETPERLAERKVNDARRALGSAYTEERAAVAAIVERPRVRADGSPACGNTNGKPPPCDDKIADQYVTARIQRLVAAGRAIDRARTQLVAAEKALAKVRGVEPDAIASNGLALEVVP